ncbi:MAG: hypothetical protein EXS36_13870 [Pedosphaera sp.]|nr:hypothetical protein [Pedosphaera sp.]
MTYLVDVNIVSEPTKTAPNAKVVDWLAAHERDLVVDSIILGELLIGILTLPPGRKRGQLERWFADVVETIDCLPWDAQSVVAGLNWSWSRGAKGTFCRCWTV